MRVLLNLLLILQRVSEERERARERMSEVIAAPSRDPQRNTHTRECPAAQLRASARAIAAPLTLSPFADEREAHRPREVLEMHAPAKRLWVGIWIVRKSYESCG